MWQDTGTGRASSFSLQEYPPDFKSTKPSTSASIITQLSLLWLQVPGRDIVSSRSSQWEINKAVKRLCRVTSQPCIAKTWKRAGLQTVEKWSSSVSAERPQGGSWQSVVWTTATRDRGSHKVETRYGGRNRRLNPEHTNKTCYSEGLKGLMWSRAGRRCWRAVEGCNI